MSYNVRHCSGSDDVVDEVKVATVISANNPDVIAIQELDSCNARSSQYQAGELGKLTQMNATYGRTIPFRGGSYGIGILSKEKPIHVKRIPLPGVEARLLLVCEFDEYIFACTHLCYQNQTNRVSSMEIILQEAQNYSKPFFIAGDFNTQPTTSEMQTFKNNFTILSDVTQNTYPASEPKSCIDYIAVYTGNLGNNGLQTLAKGVINEPDVSDHRPIYATLTWPLVKHIDLHVETVCVMSSRNKNLPSGFPARINSAYPSAYQGTAVYGCIYTNDCNARKLLAYPIKNSADTILLSYAVGTNSYGIATDDNNNLILREDDNSDTPNRLILYNTFEKRHVTIDFTLPYSGKTNYISASGDVFSSEGGYIYLYPNSQKYVEILQIKNGALQDVLPRGPLSETGSNGYVIPRGNDPDKFYYQSATSGIYLYDTEDKGLFLENGSTVAPNLCNAIGGIVFEMDGHEILVHPSGRNYNGGFTIKDVTAYNYNLHTELPLGSAGVKNLNLSMAQFFKIERLADNSVLLYEYCYGNGVALYHIYTETTGIKSVRPAQYVQLTLSPNPCTDILEVSTDVYIQTINIYAINGHCLQRHTFNDKSNCQKIDVSGLQAGTYILKCNNASAKFIKK